MNKTVKTVIITATITLFLTRIFYGTILKPYDNEVTKKITTINKIIKEKGLYDVNEEELADYAAAGLTLGIDDKYTNYYTKEQFKDFLDNVTNGSYTIGVVVTVDAENRIIVQSVLEDSAAYKAGVKTGDIILEVNSVKYNGDELEKAVSVMRGDDIEQVEGTKLNLKILRNNAENNLTIIREKKKFNSVKSKMLENNIGYLRITSFNNASDEDGSKDTYDEFIEHLQNLKINNMNKFILDLRNNPGGSLDVVKKITDELLPEGIITYTEDKKGNRIEYKSDSDELNVPIIVLVNGNSASASEVLTGALKDYNKATIVGTKTYGKGVVQSVIPLSDGSGISITTSKYFTPKGICIHDVGIEPDVVIESDEDFGIAQNNDIQLKHAIELFSN